MCGHRQKVPILEDLIYSGVGNKGVAATWWFIHPYVSVLNIV